MKPVDTGKIDQDIRDIYSDLVQWRRHIHANPEVGPVQLDTVKYVKKQFKAMENTTFIEGAPEAGLVIDIPGSGDGPTIAFRADMDAVEVSESTSEDHQPNQEHFRSRHKNRMHACGHDVHTAVLIGFGKIIHRHRDRLKGKIRLLFQPGEEGYSGGKQMVEAGHLDGVHQVFALHCWPSLAVGQIGLRKGPFFASMDYFTVTLTGIGGHGAFPERASDQILAMSRIINDLQSLIPRKTGGLTPAVLSVCYAQSGVYDDPTVMPVTARFRGSIRAFSNTVRDTIEKEFKDICKHSAWSVHPECNCEIDYDPVYPQTVNDSHLAARAGDVFSRFISKENLFPEYGPILGSEDFSFMTQKVPGVLFLLGGTLPENLSERTPFLHNPSFDVDESSMLFGVQAFKRLAIELLS